MATAELTTHLKVTVGGVEKTFGSKSTPVDVTITSEHIFEVRGQCDDNYLDEVIWTTGDGNIDNFSLLWFESDIDVFLELRSDMGTDEFILVEAKAGVPLVLASDDIAGYDTATRFDDAELVENTDWAQCDRISVQNNVADAIGDATYHLVLMN